MGSQTDVAIVGAGPYGLSLSAHLRTKGVGHRIFGHPMTTWRAQMPAGMALKSDPFASNLYDPEARWTLAAYCQEIGRPYAKTGWAVPLETFIAYGDWFQQHAVPNLERRLATHVSASGAGYSLTLDDGETVEARRVVLTVGIRDFAYTPPDLATLPPELVSHSSQHPEPARMAGRDVTVLGGGASALDLALLLHEAGAKVRLIARAGQLKFHSRGARRPSLVSRLRQPRSGLGVGWSGLAVEHFPGPFAFLPDQTRIRVVGRLLGPAAGVGVRERLEGKVPFLLRHRILEAAPKRNRLVLRLAGPDGETTVETDHLVAGTGYRADVSRLDFLDPALANQIKPIEGAPRLKGDFQSSAPGLYFAGLAAAYTFGPLQRFALGARFAARTISASLA